MKEKKSISMDISKDEFLKMLSVYYSEKLEDNINVMVNVSKVTSGYGYSEQEECDLEFYFNQEITVGNVKVVITNTLCEDDLNEALNETVDKLNYSVESFEYKSGIRVVDDYDDIYKEPYFDGVKVELKEKGIKKVLEER